MGLEAIFLGKEIGGNQGKLGSKQDGSITPQTVGEDEVNIIPGYSNVSIKITPYQEGLLSRGTFNNETPKTLRFSLKGNEKNNTDIFRGNENPHKLEKDLFQKALALLDSTSLKDNEYSNRSVVVDIFCHKKDGSVMISNDNTPEIHAVVLHKGTDDSYCLIDPSNGDYSKLIAAEFGINSVTEGVLYGSAGAIRRDCIDVAVKICFEIEELLKSGIPTKEALGKMKDMMYTEPKRTAREKTTVNDRLNLDTNGYVRKTMLKASVDAKSLSSEEAKETYSEAVRLAVQHQDLNKLKTIIGEQEEELRGAGEPRSKEMQNAADMEELEFLEKIGREELEIGSLADMEKIAREEPESLERVARARLEGKAVGEFSSFTQQRPDGPPLTELAKTNQTSTAVDNEEVSVLPKKSSP